MNQTQGLVLFKPLRHRLHLVISIVFVMTLGVACTSDALKMGTSSTSSGDAATYCLQSISVRTGKHELPAFNDASTRVMKTILAARGYSVACDGADDSLDLAYEMAFDAQSLSWRAQMRLSDKQGQSLGISHATDAIRSSGAFQYTTESTAQKLLEHILDN